MKRWGVLVLVLLQLSPVWAVTRDASSQGQGNTSPLTVSRTVTSSGGNFAIFLGCALRSTSVTLTAADNGTSMTLIRSDKFVSGTALSTWLFGLAAPTTGTHNWVVTQTGGPVNIVCGALSATNVNQSSLTTSNLGGCVSSGTSASSTLTTTANDLLFDIMGLSSISQALAQGAGQTDEITPAPLEQSNLTGGASSQAGSVDGVMSWSWTNSGGNCHSAISIAHQSFSVNFAGRRRTF